MRVWGIVPARGGSKAIPRKNIADLGGRPLLAWTVSTAVNSELSRVLVSTDCAEIAEVARGLGVEVPFLRPPSLAEDDSRSIDVVLHVLSALDDRPDAVMLLQPTSPFRTVADINACLRLLDAYECDSVISVVEVSQPPEKMRVLAEGRLAAAAFSGEEGLPRQQLTRYVIPNGAVYLTRSAVLEARSFFGADSVGWEMPMERSLNIDHPFDLEVARALVAQRAVSQGCGQ